VMRVTHQATYQDRAQQAELVAGWIVVVEAAVSAAIQSHMPKTLNNAVTVRVANQGIAPAHKRSRIPPLTS